MGLSPSSAFLVPAATPDTTNSQQIGATAPKAASSWRAQTLSQALDEVLFPTIPPTYVQPVATITSTLLNNPYEKGSSPQGGLAGSWQQNDGGSLTDWVYLRDDVVSSGGSFLPIAGFPGFIIPGTYKLRVFFNTGPQKPNNKGVLSGTPPGGFIDSTGIVVTVVVPYYYIKSPISFTREQFTAAIAAGNANNIAGATLTKVVASSAGTLTIPYNLNNQFFGVAYPGAAKANYFITTFDSGLLTAVFSARTTASTSGQNNIWTNETFNYHLTPGPITNSNANIQIS